MHGLFCKYAAGKGLQEMQPKDKSEKSQILCNHTVFFLSYIEEGRKRHGRQQDC